MLSYTHNTSLFTPIVNCVHPKLPADSDGQSMGFEVCIPPSFTSHLFEWLAILSISSTAISHIMIVISYAGIFRFLLTNHSANPAFRIPVCRSLTTRASTNPEGQSTRGSVCFITIGSFDGPCFHLLRTKVTKFSFSISIPSFDRNITRHQRSNVRSLTTETIVKMSIGIPLSITL